MLDAEQPHKRDLVPGLKRLPSNYNQKAACENNRPNSQIKKKSPQLLITSVFDWASLGCYARAAFFGSLISFCINLAFIFLKSQGQKLKSQGQGNLLPVNWRSVFLNLEIDKVTHSQVTCKPGLHMALTISTAMGFTSPVLKLSLKMKCLSQGTPI